MKRILLLFVVLSVVLQVSAQNSIETAIQLQEGNNSYTFEETSTGQQMVYYEYTAPAGEGMLVAFTASQSYISSQMSVDGTYETMIAGMYSNDNNTVTYPVKSEQRVILVVSGYGLTTVEFNIALTEADVDAGAACDDAIELSDTEVFMPSYYDRLTYNTAPTYLSYTCPEDGVLEMYFSGSVSSLGVQVGCEGTPENITVNSTAKGYIAKCEVEAGNTYIFQASAYSCLMVSVILTHPVLGESCDMPFDGATENVLPKSPGKYWYSYTTDQTGFMVISSEHSLAGGTLSIWSSCNAYSADATIDGYFALRSRVYADYEYLICIEKNEATADDETFTIRLESEQAGDSQYNPIAIDANAEVTLPLFNGTYYYSVTVPEGNNRFLVVDATSATINHTATQVGIYNEYDTYTALALGKDYARAEVSGLTNYIIKWECNEGYNSFPFTVYYEDIAQGETCSNPFQAVEGANDLMPGGDKYYVYTATQDGWLIVDTEVSIEVSFLRDCNTYSSEFYATKIANITKTELQEGESCIIKFANIEEETTFFLSEESYTEGQSCGTAIPVELGDTALPESAGSIWYLYTATQQGVVTISSDIVYEQSSDYMRSSAVKVLSHCDEYGNNITQSSADGTIFRGDFVVEEGDVLYINVVTVSAQVGKTLTLSIRELNEGEACSYPIEITTGEVTLPVASRNSPVWYAVQLEAGEFTVESSNYNFFSMYMYDSCDADTYIAQSQYDGSISGYSLKYNVETAGKYLLKLESTYNSITVVVEGVHSSIECVEAVCGVSIKGNDIVVSGNGSRTDVVICDVTGKIVVSQAVYNSAVFTVDRGIYIVKVADTVSKVAIR